MTSKKILANYKYIQYKASDGVWYPLSDKFPIALEVNGSDSKVYLDTGGHMDECYFSIYNIEGNKLFNTSSKNKREVAEIRTPILNIHSENMTLLRRGRQLMMQIRVRLIKILLFILSPVWGPIYILIDIIREIWEEISDYVEKVERRH